MEDQRAPRRKKVVKTERAGTEKAGSRANVIRPHKRTDDGSAKPSTSTNTSASTAASAPAAASSANASAPATVTIGQFISAYMAKQSAGAYSDTVWGNNLPKKEASVRSLLSIPANDEMYLASEVSVILRGKVALALCASGLYFRDLTGTVRKMGWADLPKARIGYQGSTLVIGNYQLAFHDADKLAALLTQIQSRIA